MSAYFDHDRYRYGLKYAISALASDPTAQVRHSINATYNYLALSVGCGVPFAYTPDLFEITAIWLMNVSEGRFFPDMAFKGYATGANIPDVRGVNVSVSPPPWFDMRTATGYPAQFVESFAGTDSSGMAYADGIFAEWVNPDWQAFLDLPNATDVYLFSNKTSLVYMGEYHRGLQSDMQNPAAGWARDVVTAVSYPGTEFDDNGVKVCGISSIPPYEQFGLESVDSVLKPGAFKGHYSVFHQRWKSGASGANGSHEYALWNDKVPLSLVTSLPEIVLTVDPSPSLVDSYVPPNVLVIRLRPLMYDAATIAGTTELNRRFDMADIGNLPHVDVVIPLSTLPLGFFAGASTYDPVGTGHPSYPYNLFSFSAMSNGIIENRLYGVMPVVSSSSMCHWADLSGIDEIELVPTTHPPLDVATPGALDARWARNVIALV